MIAQELSNIIGVPVSGACKALGLPRTTFYRRLSGKHDPLNYQRRSPLALSEDERENVMKILCEERFMDRSPHEIYHALLDEGIYYCSLRTMYRILESNESTRERRKHVKRTKYTKPELLATMPNQVWSWDISKLKGPKKWTYFYLYVILDIFSRYVVGWMVADRESSELAKHLLTESCEKQNISEQNALIIHADRGPSMKSQPVAQLLGDLGVTKSHSRPYTSNDNPYSEAQFKTLKYCPQFPERFGCIQDARQFCRDFFKWYNFEHRHAGISMVTPSEVHFGVAEGVIAKRNQVLKSAFKCNPARFKYRVPAAKSVPKEAWINKPNTSIPELPVKFYPGKDKMRVVDKSANAARQQG